MNGTPEQTELVERYCQEAERLLSGAGDHDAALRMRDELCERFRKECRSSLIVNATRDYLTRIIDRTWDPGGAR